MRYRLNNVCKLNHRWKECEQAKKWCKIKSRWRLALRVKRDFFLGIGNMQAAVLTEKDNRLIISMKYRRVWSSLPSYPREVKSTIQRAFNTIIATKLNEKAQLKTFQLKTGLKDLLKLTIWAVVILSRSLTCRRKLIIIIKNLKRAIYIQGYNIYRTT